MRDLLLAMVFLTIAEGLNAFFATRRKEKMMVADGGQPLPQSAYIFLGVQYLFRTVFGLMFALWLPELPVNKFLVLIGVYCVIQPLARLCEVLIRTAIVMYLTKKYVKNSGITKE